MDWMGLLKAFASLSTIVAAILVASNLSAKVMVAGFSIFVMASLSWIAAGWLDDEPSLYLQNIVLLIVNIAGIFRWLPKTEQSASSQPVPS